MSHDLTIIKKTALLMTRPLRDVTKWRFCCGLAGGVAMPVFLINLNDAAAAVWIMAGALGIFLFSLAGELLERYLFFRAVVPLKMPEG